MGVVSTKAVLNLCLNQLKFAALLTAIAVGAVMYTANVMATRFKAEFWEQAVITAKAMRYAKRSIED
jgi:hypothetical protein